MFAFQMDRSKSRNIVCVSDGLVEETSHERSCCGDTVPVGIGTPSLFPPEMIRAPLPLPALQQQTWYGFSHGAFAGQNPSHGMVNVDVDHDGTFRMTDDGWCLAGNGHGRRHVRKQAGIAPSRRKLELGRIDYS